MKKDLGTPQNMQHEALINQNHSKLHPFIKSAHATIQAEIFGLNSLFNFFDESYIAAISLILSCNGRIILSGMGKSGHIAHKIAATFASTGTAAFFIHPAEASHGDLGMIAKRDIVILLSNSGETKELRDVIYYCKRFEIPIIGIVRKADSELAKASNIALAMPAAPEASQVNAPTTSTTMMLALGDAMAVSLMEARQFSSQDFGIFHPGGKLGLEFVRVSTLMRRANEIPIVYLETKITEVLLEMTSKHLGCVAVIDEKQNLAGVITDGDLRRHISNEFLSKTAKEIMTIKPITLSTAALAVEALALMNKKSITSLFIENEKKIVGVVHLHDCLRAGLG